MASEFQFPSARTASRVLSALAILSASVAISFLLLPHPLADVFFAAWALVSVGLTVAGGVAAWTNRTALAWLAALSLTALSIAGIWSIGLFIAPAALCLLGSALLSQLAGPRTNVQEAIVSDPPTVPEAVLKTLAGTGSVVVGGGLVYVGAVTRELFGACARETLACAIDRTYWDAVGVTVLGLIAVTLGEWLLWKQVYIARVLASTHLE
jgi:hypothetical protein